jgi:hypothetical protein
MPGGSGPHQVWSARLAPRGAARTFDYRVLQADKRVFQELGAKALPAMGQPQRVAVVGDVADGTQETLDVARRMVQEKVDYVVTSGDLAYPDGTVDDYRQKFFPVLNADPGQTSQGAPLLRNTVMVGVLGNHDVGLTSGNQFKTDAHVLVDTTGAVRDSFVIQR